jgi:L-aminopeptidase/D-esterase-like protein
MNKTLTSLSGVKVGHSTHLDKLTGCTVVLFDKPYPVAYQGNGGAIGSFNTDMLREGMTFNRRHGLFIAGGSLTGLMAAGEIMQCMIDDKIGYKDNKIINPSISGAIVFDLGTHIEQFNPKYGSEAYKNANHDPVKNGNVGAGTGTSVGKFSYTSDSLMLAMKSGIGSARVDLGNGVIVSAMSAVNALGNIILPNGEILAGNRHDDPEYKYRTFEGFSNFLTDKGTNTTISIVGINVDLQTRENYQKIAQIASHGQVRAINPVNTSLDGDTVFVFSTEEISDFMTPLGQTIAEQSWGRLRIDIIGQAAAKAVQESIYNACEEAETIRLKLAFGGVVPGCKDV